MDPVLWLVAGLVLPLAAEWHLETTKVTSVPTVIPGQSVDELVCVWKQGEEETAPRITLLVWDATIPPRPGGPAEFAEKWEEPALGSAVQMARTIQWMGARQEVLVTWLPLGEQGASGLISAREVTRDTFVAAVRGLRRHDDGPLERDDLLCRRLDAN